MNLDWLIGVNVSPMELILRGSLMYWFLLLVFRFVLRRDPGSLGVADLLFLVIIADAAQNAMSGSYDTFAEGLILVGTLVCWNYALDWASYRWPAVHRLTDPPALPLIKAGRIIGRNLRREFLTQEDLLAQLREAGVDDIRQVRAAYLEGDGKLSVLKYPDGSPPRSARDGSLPGA